MKSTRHRKTQKRPIRDLGPVPQIIARLRRPYPKSQEELGALITEQLCDIWKKMFSNPLGRPRAQEFENEILDALILKQAETMGWRLALSALVHQRFREWDHQPNGPDLFVKYGKALARSARRFQKRELPPIDDPDLYFFKNETVVELQMLLRNLRNACPRKRSRPTSDELIDYFQKTVSEGDGAFIHLKTNIGSWIQYFRAHATTIKPLLLRKRAAPASLFDSWFAWCKNLEPETVRQKISELGKSAGNSQQF